MSRGFWVAAIVALAWSTAPALAQVTYEPYGSPYPAYGIPVPGGVLQPNEVLGTSPSFQVFPDAYGNEPAVRIVHRCQYPDGWNVTDFSRDINGTPNGIEHTCPSDVYGSRRIRARY